jgi:hypothetical protein
MYLNKRSTTERERNAVLTSAFENISTAPYSMVKIVPPMGLPKAAATPASPQLPEYFANILEL